MWQSNICRRKIPPMRTKEKHCSWGHECRLLINLHELQKSAFPNSVLSESHTPRRLYIAMSAVIGCQIRMPIGVEKDGCWEDENYKFPAAFWLRTAFHSYGNKWACWRSQCHRNKLQDLTWHLGYSRGATSVGKKTYPKVGADMACRLSQ